MRLDHRAILRCFAVILNHYIARLNNFWAQGTDPCESQMRHPKGIVDSKPTVPQATTKHIRNLDILSNRCTAKNIVKEDKGVDKGRLKGLHLRAAYMNDSTQASTIHAL